MKNKTENLLSSLLEEITPGRQKQTDAKMVIAAKIEDAMRAKGWKHKDLLRAMKKENPALVTRWLSGTHNFTVETLVELETALDIKLLVREIEGPVHQVHDKKRNHERIYTGSIPPQPKKNALLKNDTLPPLPTRRKKSKIHG